MTTVTIPGTQVEVTVEQLIGALKQLPAEDQQKVRDSLAYAWRQEMRLLLAEARERFAQDPMTEEEINAELNAAKQDFHAQRSHRSECVRQRAGIWRQ